MNPIKYLFKRLKQKTFKDEVYFVLGIKISKIQLYQSALQHKSVFDPSVPNNERLEYLGDAILGAIVAEYLFKKYPTKDEGFLTEMRTKMVNRNHLNSLALQIGIDKLLKFNRSDFSIRNSQIFGNTLEALVGAIFLDKGYKRTYYVIMRKMIIPFVSIDDLEATQINIKNKLISWANREGKAVAFEDDLTLKKNIYAKQFNINLFIDGKLVAKGGGQNKKEACEEAAQIAYEEVVVQASNEQ
ncbi:MAG: ribonuclease III domain-containing protein [Phycisphaerales bacterium]|nr:ribonuclease III domain-containing protein [Phycisphaerales bacterium]